MCNGKILLDQSKGGSWLLTCPDNQSRKFQFKKKMMSSGSLKILNDNTIEALGKDRRGNKVKYLTESIYE